jgi:hypothetical protein
MTYFADNMPPAIRAQVAAEEALERRGFRLLGTAPLPDGEVGAYAERSGDRIEALGRTTAAALWALARVAEGDRALG